MSMSKHGSVDNDAEARALRPDALPVVIRDENPGFVQLLAVRNALHLSVYIYCTVHGDDISICW